jgi:hypothetical protein
MEIRQFVNWVIKTSPDVITNLAFVFYLFSNVFLFVNIFKHILSSSYKKWICQGFCYRANEDTSRPISTLACSPISEECNGQASLVDTKLDTPETF